MIFNLCYVIFNTSYRRFLARRCCRFNGELLGPLGPVERVGVMLGPVDPLGRCWGPLGPVERVGVMLGPVEVLGALPCRLSRHQYKGKKTH